MYIEAWLFWTVIVVIFIAGSITATDLRGKIVDLKIKQQETEKKLLEYIRKRTNDK